jgi:hypothetical protein
MLIYSGTENFVSAMCASIPVLRPLWIKYVRKYGSTDDSSGGGGRSYRLNKLGLRDTESGRRGGGGGSGNKDGIETRIYAHHGLGDNASDETILRQTSSAQQHDGADVHGKTDIEVNYMRLDG